jgi:nucleoside-diphosphate-sugar epimerase
MKRTLVTGAAGFTGRYVAEALAAQGHEVHGLVHVHFSTDERVPGFERLHSGDLCDLATTRRILADIRPDHVVHLAAIAFVAHADVDEMYRSNIVGTRQLLEALGELPTPPDSILLASSANVYGNVRQGVLDETMPTAPANDYGVTKAAMEFVASIYRTRLPLIVVRPFNYTGRGQSTDFIIPKIVDHERRRARVIELGNMDVARDFSDVRTVADAYARLLASPGASGGTFNVCSGRAVTLHEVLDLVTDISGHKLEAKVNPALVRANEVRSLWGSPARLEGVIGPLRAIPLEETLRWMLDE